MPSFYEEDTVYKRDFRRGNSFSVTRRGRIHIFDRILDRIYADIEIDKNRRFQINRDIIASPLRFPEVVN